MTDKVLWARHTVQKYHAKVQTAPKRKRGNPLPVLKAMRILRKMEENTWCEKCRKVGPVELNHLNGWRDYSINQLIFLCRECHLNYHKEERMANRIRSRWTETEIQKVRNMVDAVMKKDGMSKMKAFDIVAERMGNTQSWIQKIYYGNIHKNRKRTTTTIATNVMTRSDAIAFWRDMKRWGITVVN